MAKVEVAATALAALESLILTHSLPPDTKSRFRNSLRALGTFPELGSPLEGRWASSRFVLGPWRWMIIVYQFNQTNDVVTVVAIHDGRSSRAATSRHQK